MVEIPDAVVAFGEQRDLGVLVSGPSMEQAQSSVTCWGHVFRIERHLGAHALELLAQELRQRAHAVGLLAGEVGRLSEVAGQIVELEVAFGMPVEELPVAGADRAEGPDPRAFDAPVVRLVPYEDALVLEARGAADEWRQVAPVEAGSVPSLDAGPPGSVA